MKIKYVKMENSVSEATDLGNPNLIEAHKYIQNMIYNSSLRKAEKVDKLSAKNLLTVGYSAKFGYDFMYQVQGGYIHVLVKETKVTLLYVSHSGTAQYKDYKDLDFLPKFYLEEGSLSYFRKQEGINFLARDGYFYATDFVKVEAKAMSERKD